MQNVIGVIRTGAMPRCKCEQLSGVHEASDQPHGCVRAARHRRSGRTRAGGDALSLPFRPTERGDAVVVKQIWTANAYRNFNYLIACR